MGNDLQHVSRGSHVLTVYYDQESQLDKALKFLKKGLDFDEIIMLVTDYLSKDEIRKKMQKEWNVDVEQLESSGIININTVEECYYANGFPDPLKVIEFWNTMKKTTLARGKKGFRVFADMHPFFEKGHGAEVVHYESNLSPEYEVTLTGICAYDIADIESLTMAQYEALIDHHRYYLR